MNYGELIDVLKRLKVQTGSLACLSCGYEHNCSISGCAIIRATIEELCLIPKIEAEKNALLKAARSGATCDNCLHMGESASKCNDDMGPCSSCEVDCYCKDCFSNSKWELKMEREASGKVTYGYNGNYFYCVRCRGMLPWACRFCPTCGAEIIRTAATRSKMEVEFSWLMNRFCQLT